MLVQGGQGHGHPGGDNGEGPPPPPSKHEGPPAATWTPPVQPRKRQVEFNPHFLSIPALLNIFSPSPPSNYFPSSPPFCFTFPLFYPILLSFFLLILPILPCLFFSLSSFNSFPSSPPSCFTLPLFSLFFLSPLFSFILLLLLLPLFLLLLLSTLIY